MRMPYQCLERCGNVLVAASGSRIDSFSLEDGSLLSTWKCPVVEGSKVPEEINQQEATDTPPAKRRKLSGAAEEQENGNESAGRRKANNRSDAVASGLAAPAIIALTSTKSGRHVIAVSGEDKSIRVFKHDGVGLLQQMSQRVMPKRPCAIAITEDDSTIISADKFGDVYSLPLLPSEQVTTELPITQNTKSASQTPEPTLGKAFVPAANDLTVHSVRNRKALENQKRQTNRPSEKSEPTFEHKLLLGHVSMLTDITLVSLENRTYIITADRDEHIRVSRGIPQSHIIEGFCLGHAEFISRLCIPKERPGLLISGGGEDELYVWDWLSGKIVSKADLKSHITAVLKPTNSQATEGKKPTVSGIYHARFSTSDFIVVTSEGIPVLFVFTLTAQNNLAHTQTISLEGNALAIAQHSSERAQGLTVSIDTFHKAGSTTELRADTEQTVAPLVSFKFENNGLTRLPPAFVSAGENEDVPGGKEATGRLTNLLYNLENLRKRDGGAQEDEQ